MDTNKKKTTLRDVLLEQIGEGLGKVAVHYHKKETKEAKELLEKRGYTVTRKTS